jgi:hypothetical protein
VLHQPGCDPSAFNASTLARLKTARLDMGRSRSKETCTVRVGVLHAESWRIDSLPLCELLAGGEPKLVRFVQPSERSRGYTAEATMLQNHLLPPRSQVVATRRRRRCFKITLLRLRIKGRKCRSMTCIVPPGPFGGRRLLTPNRGQAPRRGLHTCNSGPSTWCVATSCLKCPKPPPEQGHKAGEQPTPKPVRPKCANRVTQGGPCTPPSELRPATFEL